MGPWELYSLHGKRCVSKLEAVGFVASERHQGVNFFTSETPRTAWTYKVEVTARGKDFMSRKWLRCSLSLLPSKANKWVVFSLTLATILGGAWSWVSNLAALAG